MFFVCEEGGFTTGKGQIFSMHTTLDNKKKNNDWSFHSGKSYDYPDTTVFENLHSKQFFFPHEHEKPAFRNSYL